MRTKPTAPPFANPRLLLQYELERRCRENPRYSLRAFAKAIGLSPTVLSLVLNGKRPLSGKAALKVAAELSVSAEDHGALIQWANTKPRSRPRLSDAANLERNSHQMSLDSFSLISDWFHYAILSLISIPGARFEPNWIARRLKICEIEAKAAMERLQRLALVEKAEGCWKQSIAPIRIGNDVPTAATKKFQRQLLSKAIESIENEPAENRDFSSITVAINPSQIPYARERIRKFRRELGEELEALASPKRVYNLTVHIFPVSESFNMSDLEESK